MLAGAQNPASTAPTPFGAYLPGGSNGQSSVAERHASYNGHDPKFVGLLGNEFNVKAGRGTAYIATLKAIAVAKRHRGSVERYDPDLWTEEFAFLDGAGEPEIQSDLFYDYRN